MSALGIRRLSIGVALAGAMLTSCAQAQFNGPALTVPQKPNQKLAITTDPAILYPADRELRIGQDDVISVTIFGALAYAPPVKVSHEGTVHLPLIGSLLVSGLTVHQAEDAITRSLIAAGMFKDPQVSVEITAAVNQFATVTGELHAVVPIFGERRLLDVLVAAGAGGGVAGNSTAGIASGVILTGTGFPASASHIITVFRRGQAQPIVVDLGTDPARGIAADIPILAGDLILVSKIGVVYVLGAFAKQGAIPLDENTPLTLLQLTTLAGGYGFEGRFNDLRIIRTVGLQRTSIKVDIKRVVNGKDADPILQADDIVYLPSTPFKSAIKAGGISTVTSVLDFAVIAIAQL